MLTADVYHRYDCGDMSLAEVDDMLQYAPQSELENLQNDYPRDNSVADAIYRRYDCDDMSVDEVHDMLLHAPWPELETLQSDLHLATDFNGRIERRGLTRRERRKLPRGDPGRRSSYDLVLVASTVLPLPRSQSPQPSPQLNSSPPPAPLPGLTSLSNPTTITSADDVSKHKPRVRRERTVRSPYFPKVSPVRNRTNVSCVPFPSTRCARFGLIQEELAHDPFQLLVAVTILNKTRGMVAIPVLRLLIARYPTPQDLKKADLQEITRIIQHLGLQNTRARRYIELGRTWVDDPPRKGFRRRKLHYPSPGDGKDVKPNELLADDDERSGAWEVAHLPTAGPYAIDSWRIFCRDQLRGLATGWNGEGARDAFEPEWKRVVPRDKELRAFLRWMWLREGWKWDPLTGERVPASQALIEEGRKGGVVWEVEDGVLQGGRQDGFGRVEAEGYT
ncbi:MAG: hypothetical protein M1833_006378 [Piccolia ochrophora]|nr:MAG: hypothetical protein M1833_006378 [Piccolia ochrophora]